MASDGAPRHLSQFCGTNFKDTDHLVEHERQCKHNPYVHVRIESLGDVLLSQHEKLVASVIASLRTRPRPRRATLSDDEPGTSNPDQVLMTCSDKSSSSSVESYGGDERRRVDALASIAQMQQQNMKAGINIDDQEHPSVMFRGMASDGPQENSRCSFCDKHFKGRRSCAEHELRCKNNPDAHSHTQIQSSGNAQGGIDVLNFHVPRKRRTARIPVLPEQPVKKPASDYAQGGINDNDAPRTPPRPTTSEVNADPSVIQRQNNDLSAIDTNSDKQKETISGGVDTNIPDHKDPSVMQMQSNLPPHNNSSDHKAPTCSFSSTDDLNAQVPVDANSDMEKKTHAIQIRRRTH